MLIILSTSDYLLNQVLYSIVKSLRITIDYLCERFRMHNSSDNDSAVSSEDLENITENSTTLSNCVEFIIKMRSLDNFHLINSKVKLNLLNILNSTFINLTDCYPLLAIQMSKLIQLLSLSGSDR